VKAIPETCKHTSLKLKSESDCLGVGEDQCVSVCVHVSELALPNPPKSVGLVRTSHHDDHIKNCSRHEIAE
jgi:hypothetical protein